MKKNTPPYAALAAFAASLLALSTGCALQAPSVHAPAMLAPGAAAQPGARRTAPAIDLTQPGAVARGSQPATVIDTRMIASLPAEPFRGPFRAVREVLPAHGKAAPYPAGQPNNLPLGATLAEPRANPTPQFPGIGQTPWVPPDCTLAVGPNHVIATVNMAIAFYKKDGTLQFFQYLDSSGSPGFFEDTGAGGYTFDPKCFYDHLAQRFVVVAPEVYGPTEAWITIAVSDDNDPNGLWYKYRTDAVIADGAQTYWWDYPGFGYDHRGYYVTGNLFGLNQGGWGGVGFRVFDKAPMLTGQPAVYWTTRDAGAASVQVAQHFGTPIAPYFVSVNSGNSLRIHAIKNPVSSPTLVTTTVAVPGFSGPVNSSTSGGTISSVDARIFNSHWRAGKLYATHHVSKLTPQGNHNVARWYSLNTNNWPTSGSVTLAQSGNVDNGDSTFAFFPAISSNSANQVGMVMGLSTASTNVQVAVTGRKPTDPAGTMGTPVVLTTSPVGSSGRWGDYYDIAVDPANDTRFWVVGEISEPWGWSTWIGSFTVDAADAPIPIFDESGDAYPDIAKPIDVLANDFDTNGDTLIILSFDATSAHGGTVTRSVGSGPGGRDRLVYTAPNTGYTGADTFNYTVRDPGGLTATTFVTSNVKPPIPLRDPDSPPSTAPGVSAAYYTLTTRPFSVPDFSVMTPYAAEVIPSPSFPWSNALIGGSGVRDRLGVRYTGYLNVPETNVYTVYVSCDEGANLSIGDALITANDGPNNSMIETSGVVGLKAGRHRVTIDFYEWWNSQGLSVALETPTIAKYTVPAADFSHDSCPADYNGDGFVDGIDSDQFVNDFEAGNIAADFNGDGFVDGIDYDGFMNHFDAGC